MPRKKNTATVYSLVETTEDAVTGTLEQLEDAIAKLPSGTGYRIFAGTEVKVRRTLTVVTETKKRKSLALAMKDGVLVDGAHRLKKISRPNKVKATTNGTHEPKEQSQLDF